jgi:hypothetical protein
MILLSFADRPAANPNVSAGIKLKMSEKNIRERLAPR